MTRIAAQTVTQVRRAPIVVLASGAGSNLQAILDASAAGELDAEVVGVFSDRRGAYALERADAALVATVAVHPAPEAGESRRLWDAKLADVVEGCEPDWIVLAGFMRILSSSFLDRFPGRVINLHPALPGELPGTRSIERAYREFQEGQRTSTGVMVHLVPDEGVDVGPVLAVTEVPILATDSLENLTDRMHTVERELLIATLQRLVANTNQGERT
jgi:phosphoribosylglycinamide formyltransferase 1